MTSIPKMMTIRQISALGIMPEHALRQLCRDGKISYVIVGKNKQLVNYTALCEQLSRPGGENY